MEENLYPSWNAQNMNSVHLAEKLGYIPSLLDKTSKEGIFLRYSFSFVTKLSLYNSCECHITYV